jgi:GDP-L-fucose synthase
MVGSALVRRLARGDFGEPLTVPRSALDLRDQTGVAAFLRRERPDWVFLAAARVGGIGANMAAPAKFLLENLLIQTAVLQGAADAGVKGVLFLGSSCIYPRECRQPMREEDLLTGKLEPTNEGYALAKIAGLRLAEYLAKSGAFRLLSLMPCNLYGTNDSYDLAHSHVLSALVRRFEDARIEGAPEVTLWGTGSSFREFLHVDDLAEAAFHLLGAWHSPDFVNVGTGEDLTIRDLASEVARATGFEGRIRWDSTKPDGMPRKCLDVERLRSTGFRHRIDLPTGIRSMVEDYRRLRPALLEKEAKEKTS